MNQIVISELYIYPIKSCRGVALRSSAVLTTGLTADRRWMIVNEAGMFVTQRELPRMALIAPALHDDGLMINAPTMSPLIIDGRSPENKIKVTVWRDQLTALDEGDAAAAWLSTFLGKPLRLVRFDESQTRTSSRDWTGDVVALNQFSDGFPFLAISTASLADLNARLPDGLMAPLPMNRFRPNLVLDGLPAYGEDDIHELRTDTLCLRLVKPCTRCKITTTDQATGVVQGTEPFTTLMKYRRNPALRGVTFGQNMILVAGAGSQLTVGQTMQVSYRSGASSAPTSE